MRPVIRILVVLGALGGLSGCTMFGGGEVQSARELMAAPETRMLPDRALPFCCVQHNEIYMVMPEEGGKAGTVDVTFDGDDDAVLHGDYSAMSVTDDCRQAYTAQAYTADEAQMLELFGPTMAALPKKPLYMKLYFTLGTDQLTPESQAESDKIYGEIARRKTTEVILVGHTDTIDTAANNLTLSINRAKAVRRNLIDRGVPASVISIDGRGEEDLLVKTADNVNEPKNRRVEMSVR